MAYDKNLTYKFATFVIRPLLGKLTLFNSINIQSKSRDLSMDPEYLALAIGIFFYDNFFNNLIA